MEAHLVAGLPDELGWQFEPKWDGFRCLAFRSGSDVDLRAKSGKPLARYFPEIVAGLRDVPLDPFVLDGELAIAHGDVLSFDALQMRLHPAESRIRKLARETPAFLILFDALALPGRPDLAKLPLTDRRVALEEAYAVAAGSAYLRLSPYTRKRADAQRWLDTAGGAIDGVVAKRIDEPCRPGERAMLKVKRMRTADCVVGGFRYESNARRVGSLLLGLYNDAGKLDHVGFTSAIASSDKPALTKTLEKLIGPPGFDGNAPGAPSRWSTERSTEWQPLKPKLVVEVRYDHVTGNRFRHGTGIVRWRPDKAPRQCGMEQLGREARPGKLIAQMMRGS
ncbi:MAG: ATP-dependent DNA ligase [Methylobacteriaceae bacterium]|nr:ATP-dependent DNA ligase [Methylobacteriaceae bacterium]